MLQSLRKWGFVVFLIPFVIFWVDDFLTDWHHHGTESYRAIFRENLIDDFVTISAWVLLRTFYMKWRAYVTAQLHCECPYCHFKWTMHPNDKMPFCPHCSAPEPQGGEMSLIENAPRTEKCECGCCHAEDFGACPGFETGANGRCVYCDHGMSCHERDKENRYFNGPLRIGDRTTFKRGR